MSAPPVSILAWLGYTAMRTWVEVRPCSLENVMPPKTAGKVAKKAWKAQKNISKSNKKKAEEDRKLCCLHL